MSAVPAFIDGLAVDREPWTRQPRESERAWHAFQTWRDAPAPRSMDYVQASTGAKRSSLTTWSRRWNWTERTRAFDVWMDTTQLVADAEAIKEMNTRHAAIAKAMSAKVAARVQRLDVDELSPGEVGRWMQVIAMVERLARGEVTERRDAPETQVNILNVDTSPTEAVTDTAYLGEVMDRLAARGIIPAPAAQLPASPDSEVLEVPARVADSDPAPPAPSAPVISHRGVEAPEDTKASRQRINALHHDPAQGTEGDVRSRSDAAQHVSGDVDSQSDDIRAERLASDGTPPHPPHPPSGSHGVGPPGQHRSPDAPTGGPPISDSSTKEPRWSHRRRGS